ncbi:MAG: hypothetical protein ABI680_03580 [Chthoniobacteraceae bacterium]
MSPQTTYNPGLNGADVVADTLTYFGLSVTGGALESLPSYEFTDRELFDPGPTTGIYYLSFLIAKNPSASGYGGLSFWGDNNGGENGFLGYSNTGDVNDNNSGLAAPMPSVPSDATLLVYRMDLDTGLFDLYINPTVGASEPVPNGTFTGPAGGLQAVGLNAEGGFLLDEIRLGETFEDVTPAVPEPSAALLGLIGLGSPSPAGARGRPKSMLHNYDERVSESKAFAGRSVSAA